MDHLNGLPETMESTIQFHDDMNNVINDRMNFQDIIH